MKFWKLAQRGEKTFSTRWSVRGKPRTLALL